MLTGTNLKNFFLGSVRDRELRETQQAWEQTQEYWGASPLGNNSLFDLSLYILQQIMNQCERPPADPIWNAVGSAVEALLRAEDIAGLEINWEIIAANADCAVEFRKMLARRRRWATDFARLYDNFTRIVLDTLMRYFGSLPEVCYGAWDDKQDGFEVVLLDLLDNPTEIIEQLFMLPYDDESFRLDLFYTLRDRCAGNLLVASGFLRSDNIRALERKMIMPSAQRNKTGAELAELYLAGSPLKALLDLPVPFHIPDEVRFEHCHIVGGTGHGKTQLMQKLIHADLIASQNDYRSVVVIDSQGDLINKLVRLDLFSPGTPNSLADRVILVDPADVEFPVALNLFDAHLERVREYRPADRERVLNGVIELYELFFGAFLGAELTQKQGVVFKYLARLMLAIPDATIHTLMRLMEDGKGFKPYMDQLDGSARYFFETEFFHPSFAATKKQILRRLWGVLSTPAFERMFAQQKNKLDLFEAMNDGKIVLVSTAKDLLKREGSQLLGRFFIAMIMQAALERSTLPSHLRRPTLVYVDEAQEYFDDSIETILTQARKYQVGLTLAHQSLDQLSPRLRSAILANTSMKCAGGVSAKDARALTDELRTTPEFIQGMKRRGERTEFAVWVKHLTGHAIRLTVPLGFLERQPVLDEEDFDGLLANNRKRYCGTLADSKVLFLPPPKAEPTPKPVEQPVSREDLKTDAQPGAPKPVPPTPAPPSTPRATSLERATAPESETSLSSKGRDIERPPLEEKELGKGGPKHRYLQMLVKDLAEQQGFRATVEAPLKGGAGQIDVQLDRDQVSVAVEISVSTPADHERQKLARCLQADYTHVAVVLAKTKGGQTRFRDLLLGNLSDDQKNRVSLLSPEEVPDFITSLAPPPEPTESVVKGYRVRVSHSPSSPEETKARKDALTRIIAQSLGRPDRAE